MTLSSRFNNSVETKEPFIEIFKSVENEVVIVEEKGGRQVSEEEY